MQSALRDEEWAPLKGLILTATLPSLLDYLHSALPVILSEFMTHECPR